MDRLEAPAYPVRKVNLVAMENLARLDHQVPLAVVACLVCPVFPAPKDTVVSPAWTEPRERWVDLE